MVHLQSLCQMVDLLKHNIPDPSLVTSNSRPDKEHKDYLLAISEEFLASPIFVHSTLHDKDLCLSNVMLLKKALFQYFNSSSLCKNTKKEQIGSSGSLDLFFLPVEVQNDSHILHCESFACMLGKLHDQILSMSCRSFAKPKIERDWVRNSAKMWDMVKKSPIIDDYCKTLQSSGLFYELCVLGNLCPETVEEAIAMVPSIKVHLTGSGSFEMTNFGSSCVYNQVLGEITMKIYQKGMFIPRPEKDDFPCDFGYKLPNLPKGVLMKMTQLRKCCMTFP